MPVLTALNVYAASGDTAETPLVAGNNATWGPIVNADFRAVNNLAADHTTFKATAVVKGTPTNGLVSFATPSISVGLLLPVKPSGSGAPAFAATNVGQGEFNPADGKLYIADGSAWVAIGAGGTTPIASPTVTGTVKTNYTDSDPIVVLSGESSGGNARGGTGAVDLQLIRVVVDEVAAADYSNVLGGQQNKASQQYGTVVGGLQNYNDGGKGIIASGESNHLAANVAGIFSGWHHTLGESFSGDFSAILAGDTNNIDAENSTVVGGNNNSITQNGNHGSILSGSYNEVQRAYGVASGNYAKATRYGEVVQAGGTFGTPGDAQTSVLVMRNTSTGGAIELFCDGAGERLFVTDNSTLSIEFTVIARRSFGTSDEVYVWRGTALATRQPAGSITILEYVIVDPVTHTTPSGEAWSVTLGVYNPTNSLTITCQHPNADPIGPPIIPARTVNWVASVRITEVQ